MQEQILSRQRRAAAPDTHEENENRQLTIVRRFRTRLESLVKTFDILKSLTPTR